MSMTPQSTTAPVVVHELDLHPEEGSEDEPLRLLASFWRQPEGDTWRLEAFAIKEDGDGTYYEPRPELTMNLPAHSLEDAAEDRHKDAQRHLQRAAEPLRLAQQSEDQADLIDALAGKLAEAGTPEASPPIVPGPTPPPPEPDKPARVRDPKAVLTHPGLPAETAERLEQRRREVAAAEAADAAGTRVKPTGPPTATTTALTPHTTEETPTRGQAPE
jgi:hypothetical protein